MTKHSPESGYPHINLSSGEVFDPEDTFTFDSGNTVTGAHLNNVLKDYFSNHPRGQQLSAHIRGEGPGLPPLFTLMGDRENGRVYLEDTAVDVTEIEPAAPSMIQEILSPPTIIKE